MHLLCKGWVGGVDAVVERNDIGRAGAKFGEGVHDELAFGVGVALGNGLETVDGPGPEDDEGDKRDEPHGKGSLRTTDGKRRDSGESGAHRKPLRGGG